MIQYPEVTRYNCIYNSQDFISVTNTDGDLRLCTVFEDGPEAVLYLGVAEARQLRQQLKHYINSRFTYES